MWIRDDCYERPPKMCFCVGPENCNDCSCPQVKAYRRRMKCLRKRVMRCLYEENPTHPG